MLYQEKDKKLATEVCKLNSGEITCVSLTVYSIFCAMKNTKY